MGIFSLDDTIAAIATPIGEGGIGIVKISGPQSTHVLSQIFAPAFVEPNAGAPFQPHPRRLTFGYIRDVRDNHTVDEVLVAVMPAPHSYTRQDVVEIQSHGGIMAVRRILQLALEVGARPAEPGEMTLRAFVNGRLDLAQAEAVLDVVHARTDAALRVAVEQLSGHLSDRVRLVRSRLVDVLAYLEASIDFVEDEIPAQDVNGPLEQAAGAIRDLLATADRGLIYRQGIRAAIVGRPNVGKSSLLNALLRGDRAIVTAIPGTTRDTLEETINLQGIPIVLVDTAGIRAHTTGEVERIGVERSRTALQRADLALLVIDGSQVLSEADRDIAALIGSKPALVIINKCDLPYPGEKEGTKQVDLAAGILPHASCLCLSALSGQGIEAMEQALVDLVMEGKVITADTPLVSNPRHKASLQQALDFVEAARMGHQNGHSLDLVAIDVREAVDMLGDITGETAGDDLLDSIFSKFCIGK